MCRFGLNKPSLMSPEEIHLFYDRIAAQEHGSLAQEASRASGPSGNREMAVLIQFPFLKP